MRSWPDGIDDPPLPVHKGGVAFVDLASQIAVFAMGELRLVDDPATPALDQSALSNLLATTTRPKVKTKLGAADASEVQVLRRDKARLLLPSHSHRLGTGHRDCLAVDFGVELLALVQSFWQALRATDKTPRHDHDHTKLPDRSEGHHTSCTQNPEFQPI